MSETVFTCEQRGSVGVLHVTLREIVHPDELDHMSQEFRQCVARTRLAAYVLDLSHLEYLTSAAIGMLINMHAHLAADGRRFAVVGQKQMVAETLGHPHLDKVFPVRTDVAAAVLAVS